MSCEKKKKRRNPFKNVMGLVLFCVGIGMALAILSGLGTVVAMIFLIIGGYILFVS